MSFDPSVTASYKLGIFGLPSTRADAKIVMIPVPWEVTTSYGSGTSRGPETILKASPQIDLFDRQLGRAYESGYHMLPVPSQLMDLNDRLKILALKVREELEEDGELSEAGENALNEVNAGCERMFDWVHRTSREILEQNKIPAVIGGDHSSPEGLILAISERYPNQVGVLHIDAHLDLRVAYQGFQRSHASIMNNVMKAEARPTKLVQVAIRDFSEEEFQLSEERPDIKVFFDQDLKDSLFEGESWGGICDRIVSELPNKVYLSFDIDGLSPEFCPNTGTPVPGGLTFDQANHLFSTIVKSGRQIVGFDLNEVAPGSEGEWDGNVGARMLYKLCGWTIKSQRA